MIVSFMPKGGETGTITPADGVIIYPASAHITLFAKDGDKAEVAIEEQEMVVIEDEGGDKGE